MKLAVALAITLSIVLTAGNVDAQVFGQGGVRGGIIRDVDADRLSGIGASAYGDFRGLGFVLGLDYQHVSREMDDGKVFGHSFGLSLGLRFSPLSLAKADRPLRFFDFYGAAILDGGLVLRGGHADRGARSSSYAAIGFEFRSGRPQLPGLVLEHQWRAEGDEYRVGNTIFVGISFTRTFNNDADAAE